MSIDEQIIELEYTKKFLIETLATTQRSIIRIIEFLKYKLNEELIKK